MRIYILIGPPLAAPPHSLHASLPFLLYLIPCSGDPWATPWRERPPLSPKLRRTPARGRSVCSVSRCGWAFRLRPVYLWFEMIVAAWTDASPFSTSSVFLQVHAAIPEDGKHEGPETTTGQRLKSSCWSCWCVYLRAQMNIFVHCPCRTSVPLCLFFRLSGIKLSGAGRVGVIDFQRCDW